MLNRKGLELINTLESRSPHLEILLRDKRLPPIFKLYLSHYQVGSGAQMAEKIVLDDKVQDEYWLSLITMYDHVEMHDEIYHAALDYIYNYETLMSELSKFENKNENWHESGLMQIGLMHWSDVLLLGIEEHNMDEIWRYGEGLSDKNQCTKLEDDIFQFIGKLSESISMDDLDDWGITKKQIYRNLDDKFWRVRR